MNMIFVLLFMPLLTALIAQNGHILVLIYFIFQKKKKKNENLKI